MWPLVPWILCFSGWICWYFYLCRLFLICKIVFKEKGLYKICLCSLLIAQSLNKVSVPFIRINCSKYQLFQVPKSIRIIKIIHYSHFQKLWHSIGCLNDFLNQNGASQNLDHYHGIRYTDQMSKFFVFMDPWPNTLKIF